MPAIRDDHSRSGLAVPVRSMQRQVVALAGFLALSYAVCMLASVPIILNRGGWFADSIQAPWMPAGWMFRTAWLSLYAGIAVAAWLIWRRGALAGPLAWMYAAQLLLNLAWPFTFFGMYPMLGVAALWIALAVIGALAVVLVLLILRFGPVSTGAGLLVLPYFSWVVFSASLNLYAAIHN